MAKKDYFKDTEDELIYLDMLEEMNFKTASEIYTEIEHEILNKYLSGAARDKDFSELTYKNLRYLILGCENCTAETRAKALATFIYRAQQPERLSPLVTNEHLMKMLHQNLEQSIEQLYKWSGVEYKG